MSPKTKTTLFLFVLGVIAWLPVTSVLLLIARHQWGHVPQWEVPVAAYLYWRDFGTIPEMQIWLTRCAVGGAVLALGPAALSFFSPNRDPLLPAVEGVQLPPPKRARSSSHGGAEWCSVKQMRKLFPGPHEQWGGVVVGEAYRVDEDKIARRTLFRAGDRSTWGQGGRPALLIDPCTEGATHGTVFAGSGGFKTTGLAIPTLLHWTGSAVVFDPPNQVGPMTAAVRRAMGQRVYTVGPGAQSVNVLSWIDQGAPSAEVDVLDVLNWVCGDLADKARGENATFAQSGRKLLASLLLDLLWNPQTPPERRTLRELRRLITTPEKQIKGLLEDIAEESHSEMARDFARSLKDIHQRTFSGAYFHATGETDFLATAAYADLLSNDECDPSCICTGAATIYLAIPMRDLAAAPGLARVLVASFQSALRRAEGRVATGRVLFLLDEARYLGRLSTLSSMMTADRKYGATVITLWQDESDQRAIWRDHAGIFSANSSWTLYAAVNDRPTSEQVSALAGKYTVITRTSGSGSSSGSTSSSSRSQNYGSSESARELIKPEEVRTMRADEAVIFRRGAPPIRCGRPIYFRRSEMLELVNPDRLRAAA